MKDLRLHYILSVFILCFGLFCSGEHILLAAAESAEAELEISEVMVKNRAVLRDVDGHFHDWIELHNISGKCLSLSGWSISDTADSDACFLPDITLEPDEYIVVYATGSDTCSELSAVPFSISGKDTLILYSPDGEQADSFECKSTKADRSLVRDGDKVKKSDIPSPGFENTEEGYISAQSVRTVSGPLMISELTSYSESKEDDWVEIVNISDEIVNLNDYYLSDSLDDLTAYQLPMVKLKPGLYYVVSLSDAAGFSISSNRDRLYLSDSEDIIDYIAIPELYPAKSYGRSPGSAVCSYYDNATKGKKNGTGFSQISGTPQILTNPGIYNSISSVVVEFEQDKSIYYTTDGSSPSTDSLLYTGPIELSKTTIIRAVLCEEGKLPGQVLTYPFIINENESLPVLSIVTDSGKTNNMSKDYDTAGNITYYNGADSFSINCGITLSGNTSVNLKKKSFNVYFRSCYGETELNYALFDSEISTFSSLNVRAGQDYEYLIFRNELWEDICLETTSNVLCQHSQYVAVYLNGSYHGIYALKENLSKSMYASYKGVEKSSVEVLKLPAFRSDSFYTDVFTFCKENDMRDLENYQHFTELCDVESFVDYFLIQGFCGNNDLVRNVRLYRSQENGLKWSFAFFDLDMASRNSIHTFTNILGPYDFEGNTQIRVIYKSLLKNKEFRSLLLERFSELYGGVLSDENLLKHYDALSELLDSSVSKDHKRWYLTYEKWLSYVKYYRDIIVEGEWQKTALKNFSTALSLTDEERAEYFPGS